MMMASHALRELHSVLPWLDFKSFPSTFIHFTPAPSAMELPRPKLGTSLKGRAKSLLGYSLPPYVNLNRLRSDIDISKEHMNPGLSRQKLPQNKTLSGKPAKTNKKNLPHTAEPSAMPLLIKFIF